MYKSQMTLIFFVPKLVPICPLYTKQEKEMKNMVNLQNDEEFLKTYGKLVGHVVNRVFRKHMYLTYVNTGLSEEDLMQIGYIGLIKARDKFSPGRAKFTTFAYKYIFGTIMREISQGSHLAASRTVKETKAKIIALEIQSKSTKDIAEILGVSEKLVLDALGYSNGFVRLDASKGDEEESSETMYTALGNGQDVEKEVITNTIVHNFLNTLTPHERNIWTLKEKYGLPSKKVGEIVGRSHQAVSKTLNGIKQKAAMYGKRHACRM